MKFRPIFVTINTTEKGSISGVFQTNFHCILIVIFLFTAWGWGQGSTSVITLPDATASSVNTDNPPKNPADNSRNDDRNISETARQAYLLRMDGRAMDARNLLEDGLLKNYMDRDCLFEAARTYYYLLQFDSAGSKINQLLALEPKNPENLELAALFMIYRGMNQMHGPSGWPYVPFTFRKGIQLYEELLRIDPTNDEMRVLLIKSYHRLPWIMGGSESKASAHMSMLENRNPFFETAAEVEMMPASEAKNRIDAWSNLIIKNNGTSAAYEELGKEYLRANEIDMALRVFTKAEQLDSTQTDYLMSLALYFLETKDAKNSRKFIDQYINHDPPLPTPLRAHGLIIKSRIEKLAGNQDGAWERLEEALALDPKVWSTPAPPPAILFRELK